MLTRWGETLDKQQVLQEYPRPQLVRESFYPLNGLWDYAITASDACPGAWDGPSAPGKMRNQFTFSYLPSLITTARGTLEAAPSSSQEVTPVTPSWE